jgi:hypothetical protein
MGSGGSESSLKMETKRGYSREFDGVFVATHFEFGHSPGLLLARQVGDIHNAPFIFMGWKICNSSCFKSRYSKSAS